MTVFEGLALSLLTGLSILTVLVLLTASKILEGVNFILSICHADIVDENPPEPSQPFVSPSNMPLGRDLMDIIGKPPTDDGNTGTFGGRQPWEPPPDVKV